MTHSRRQGGREGRKNIGNIYGNPLGKVTEKSRAKSTLGFNIVLLAMFKISFVHFVISYKIKLTTETRRKNEKIGTSQEKYQGKREILGYKKYHSISVGILQGCLSAGRRNSQQRFFCENVGERSQVHWADPKSGGRAQNSKIHRNRIGEKFSCTAPPPLPSCTQVKVIRGSLSLPPSLKCVRRGRRRRMRMRSVLTEEERSVTELGSVLRVDSESPSIKRQLEVLSFCFLSVWWFRRTNEKKVEIGDGVRPTTSPLSPPLFLPAPNFSSVFFPGKEIDSGKKMRRRRRSVIGVFLERRSAGGANRARDGSSCFPGSRIEKKGGKGGRTHLSFPNSWKKNLRKKST